MPTVAVKKTGGEIAFAFLPHYLASLKRPPNGSDVARELLASGMYGEEEVRSFVFLIGLGDGDKPTPLTPKQAEKMALIYLFNLLQASEVPVVSTEMIARVVRAADVNENTARVFLEMSIETYTGSTTA